MGIKLDRTFRAQYAIPDIHGRLDLLDHALGLLEADGYSPEKDLLVFLGDVIDRGPDSKGVIDRIQSLCEAHPDTVYMLRGNHEDFAVDCKVKNLAHARDAWYCNGGWNTEHSYPTGQMSEDHTCFLATRPLYLEAGGFFYSHAPVPRDARRKGRRGMDGSDYGLADQPYNPWELTWHYFGPECEKRDGMMDAHEGPRSDGGSGEEHLIGICGHIHRGPLVREIRSFPQYRLLDCGSGCFPSGALAVHECLSNRTIYARPEEIV